MIRLRIATFPFEFCGNLDVLAFDPHGGQGQVLPPGLI